MKRFLLLLAIGLMASGVFAENANPLPSVPPGATATVVLARPAKLTLAKGGAIDLKAGTNLVFLGVDSGTGNLRVRFRSSEGTVPIAAVGQEVPAPGAAGTPPPPPAGFPTDGSAKPLTAADIAQLPPEIRAAIAAAQADAASAAPGSAVEGRTITTTSSTPWVKVAPGTPAPAVPPGATVTRTELPVTRTEVRSAPVVTERRFHSKEEAARALAEQKARDEADAKARAEALAREAAGQVTPPK